MEKKYFIKYFCDKPNKKSAYIPLVYKHFPE